MLWYCISAAMNQTHSKIVSLLITLAALLLVTPSAQAAGGFTEEELLLGEIARPVVSDLEELLLKSGNVESVIGFASYYARRFDGRQTTSGLRYNPDKLTAAHHSLPLGTVVKVVNPTSRQEVHVTVTDRCAPRSFHFIDLSRAAAKKIGLFGKGKIKVVIIPLLEEPA